jgi:transposase
MEKWCDIRQRVLRDGVSIRQIQRETGLHFETIKKVLTHSSPPQFRLPERPKPKIGPYLGRISDILDSDRELPRKQRHTAKRIFERLQQEGYSGGYTQVKEAVRELRWSRGEVFVPLIHEPGEAQVDFGYALVKMAGNLTKVAFFAIALPYSDAMFIVAYPRECTETFQDGHVRAFRFFEGVPYRIRYDNARTSVVQITGARSRKLTKGFLQLQSHYLFRERFCRVRRANEKGVVEGIVKYGRLNYFVPVPQVESFKELNAYLEQRCRDDLNRRVRGQKTTKAELLSEERAAFLPLPAAEFDACRVISTRVSSLSLVRFDCNDYSVPVRYAHWDVDVKGYVERVSICRKDEVIATHDRRWDKEEIAFNPLHYLELLERKPGALDEAKPLAEWTLPQCFHELRRRLETEDQRRGTWEFIRVLRLLEKYSLARVERAVGKALRLQHCNRDVVAQYLYPDEGSWVSTFSLEGREHLKGVYVAPPDLGSYGQLIGGFSQ